MLGLLDVMVTLGSGNLLAHLPGSLFDGVIAPLLQPRVASLLDLLPVLHLLGGLKYEAANK